MKKYFQTFLIILFFCLPSIGQNKDFLIIKSDTIRLIIEEEKDYSIAGTGYFHSEPISEYDDEIEIEKVQYFEIKNDSLIKVYFAKGKNSMTFFHNWTGVLYCPNGDLIKDFGLTQLYFSEKGFVFQNGILKEIKIFENTSTIFSKYTEDLEIFYSFLKSSIDKTKINICENKLIYIKINSLNDKFIIDDAEILRGCDEQTNNELMRVVKTIPQWSNVYLHGKQTDYFRFIKIDLNKI